MLHEAYTPTERQPRLRHMAQACRLITLGSFHWSVDYTEFDVVRTAHRNQFYKQTNKMQIVE